MEDCEAIPNKDEHQAPLGFTKKMLLGILCETFPDKSFKRSAFYDVLQKDFPQLRFPEGHSFAKCNACVSLKDRKSKETNRFRREEIEEELNGHYKEQSNENTTHIKKACLCKTLSSF